MDAVPKTFLPMVQESRVQVTHDTTFMHEDHLPLMVLTKGWNALAAPVPKYTWDEEALLEGNR